MSVKPVAVKPLPGIKIHVVFSDGEQGIVDLAIMAHSHYQWLELRDEAFFDTVKIQPYRAIGWGDDDAYDICADLLYKVVAESKQKE